MVGAGTINREKSHGVTLRETYNNRVLITHTERAIRTIEIANVFIVNEHKPRSPLISITGEVVDSIVNEIIHNYTTKQSKLDSLLKE